MQVGHITAGKVSQEVKILHLWLFPRQFPRSEQRAKGLWCPAPRTDEDHRGKKPHNREALDINTNIIWQFTCSLWSVEGHHLLSGEAHLKTLTTLLDSEPQATQSRCHLKNVVIAWKISNRQPGKAPRLPAFCSDCHEQNHFACGLTNWNQRAWMVQGRHMGMLQFLQGCEAKPHGSLSLAAAVPSTPTMTEMAA